MVRTRKFRTGILVLLLLRLPQITPFGSDRIDLRLKLVRECDVRNFAYPLRIDYYQLSEVSGHAFSSGLMFVKNEKIRERPRNNTPVE